MAEKYNKQLLEKTHNTIFLSLDDNVLTQVLKDKIIKGLWIKLESLYMTKLLVNSLYLKQALYLYKMSSEK